MVTAAEVVMVAVEVVAMAIMVVGLKLEFFLVMVEVLIHHHLLLQVRVLLQVLLQVLLLALLRPRVRVVALLPS